ncbi:MAG: AAA family ATPase [Bacteroidia bacterium]
MYIYRINIQDFRHFLPIELVFPKEQQAGWFVLLGENGSGKTSLLRLIALNLLQQGEENNDKISPHFITNQTTEINISFQTEALGLVYQTIKLTHSINRKLNYINQEQWKSRESGNFSVAYGANRTLTNEFRTRENGQRNIDAHLSLFSNYYPLTDSLEWLKKLKAEASDLDIKEEVRDSAKKTLDKITLFLNRSTLLNGYAIEKITVNEILIKDSNHVEIQLHELADGYRSILAMTLDILYRMTYSFSITNFLENIDTQNATINLSGIVLIDEVDAHLHPSWQEQIGFQLKKHFPKLQFIVSTHSPLVCHAADVVWKLPKQGVENAKVIQLNEIELGRLKYGNILESYETQAFAFVNTRSEAAQKKLQRLAFLNTQALRRKLTEEEKNEKNGLQQIFIGTNVYDAAK